MHIVHYDDGTSKVTTTKDYDEKSKVIIESVEVPNEINVWANGRAYQLPTATVFYKRNPDEIAKCIAQRIVHELKIGSVRVRGDYLIDGEDRLCVTYPNLLEIGCPDVDISKEVAFYYPKFCLLLQDDGRVVTGDTLGKAIVQTTDSYEINPQEYCCAYVYVEDSFEGYLELPDIMKGKDFKPEFDAELEKHIRHCLETDDSIRVENLLYGTVLNF